MRRLILERKLFPCFFGSALKDIGVKEFLEGIAKYAVCPSYPESFGARVFKITRDEQGNRLTHMKITGGSLKARDWLCLDEDAGIREKVNQIRMYSGEKYRAVGEAFAGWVCAVTGPEKTYPGQGLGREEAAQIPILEPVLTYRMTLPEDCDPAQMLPKLRQLEEEDPLLRIVWNENLGEIQVQIMGEVQLQVLESIILRRFGIQVKFASGGIVYKETIKNSVEGVGHFEPLRHYAEVHLLLSPGERGSGVQLASDCPTDELALNWQRLILTHLAEKTHVGPLTGAPLTDVKLTLASGRAHPKHTEGGDFRQATYRAVRQGLRTAAARGDCVLLEPWYTFTLRLPQEAVGRALADMPRLFADFDPPVTEGGEAVITGRAPVSELMGYAREVAAYTRGRGQLACLPGGYAECHNAEEVIAAAGYDADADTENTADSVFCSHGAGVLVRWDEAPAHMHLPSVLERGQRLSAAAQEAPVSRAERADAYRAALAADKELMAIFERTYGPIRRDSVQAMRTVKRPPSSGGQPRRAPARPQDTGPEYLLVDGYNVIFAWEGLKELAAKNLDAARARLMDRLCNFAGYRRCVLILVFDAWKVKGGEREVEQYHNIYVVYTREAETADMYIEKATHEIARRHRTRVVTSDAAEQLIILGNGALRVSSRSFEEEVLAAEAEIRELLAQQ